MSNHYPHHPYHPQQGQGQGQGQYHNYHQQYPPSTSSSSAYSPRTHLPTHPSTSSSDSQYLQDSLSRLTRGEPNSNSHTYSNTTASHGNQQTNELRRQSSLRSRSVNNSRRGSIVTESLLQQGSIAGGGGGTLTPGGGGSLGPQAPRTLSRSPSTPTIRKRASMHTMGSTPPGGGIAAGAGTGKGLSRKGSLLGLHNRTTTPQPGAVSGGSGSTSTGTTGAEKSPTFTPQQPALTAVILHDAAYKHKFVRPGAKKAEIATVVERPERLTAAIMGICAAQTRVGPHKLSIHKTKRMGTLLDPEVMLVHGGEGGEAATWPKELAALCRNVGERHRYKQCEVPGHLHQGDLYLCPESREALEGCIGACYEAVDAVFGNGFSEGIGGRGVREVPTRRAFVCIRPPGHHCAESTPSGFCWINNVHIAIAHAAKAHGLTHAVILDIDLHHGDGSQSITWTLNDLLANSTPKKPPTSPIPQIAYFSLHDINSYPCEAGDIEKIRNASVNLESHNQFIQNIHLQSYTTVQEFWELYERYYSVMLTKARQFLVQSMDAYRNSKAGRAGREPRAAVFVSAGFDASEHEGAAMQRHKVHVPTGFYARFAREAVMLAEDEETGCDGRVISVLEGGYSNRAITSGVLAHLVGLAYETPGKAMLRHHRQYQYNQYRQSSISEEYAIPVTPPEYESTLRDLMEGQGEGYPVDYYDPAWWDIQHLVELENKQSKRPKKVPAVAGTNYLSATVSSAAKVEGKSPKLAGNPANKNGPPAPPVVLDWATATMELSKKLIPQIDEDELTVPQSPTGSVASTRSSKRHSVATTDAVVEGMSRMTLRERKAKPVMETRATTSMADRRKTVAGVVSPGLSATSPPIVVKKQMPTMQKIPSRAPSPPPGGRRVVSMGVPLPPVSPQQGPQRTSSTKRVEKVSSVGNIRAEAAKSPSATPSPPASATFSPPQPLAAPSSRGLRRVSSTSQIHKTNAGAKGKAGTSGKAGASRASPPHIQEDGMAPGGNDAIEQLLVNGMKKIKITYKAGDEAKQQEQEGEDRDRRLRELEALAEEKQREIDRLKAAAAATAVAGQPVKVKPQQHNPQPQGQQAKSDGAAAATGSAGGVSAVRLAAMRLESQQPHPPAQQKVGKVQTDVVGMPAKNGNASPTTSTPTQSSMPQKPQPPRTVTTAAATAPAPSPKNSPPPVQTTTPPAVTNVIAPSPTTTTPVNQLPVIVTIPPTRPTSSWEEFPENHHHAFPRDGYTDHHGYQKDHQYDDTVGRPVPEDRVTREGDGAKQQSPPPPYNSVVMVGQTVGGVGRDGSGNTMAGGIQHGQGQGQQQAHGSVNGQLGFNVMKPLTVGLGGGGGVGRGVSGRGGGEGGEGGAEVD